MRPEEQALCESLETRAAIRRRIPRAETDRIADVCEQAAALIRNQSEQIDRLARALNDCPTDCDAIGVYGEWRERNADALKIAAER